MSNQVLDVVNIAPAPVIAVAVAQVENLLPTAADDVAQNAAPDVTLRILIPSQFSVGFKLTCPFFCSCFNGDDFNLVIAVGFTLALVAEVVSIVLGFDLSFVAH